MGDQTASNEVSCYMPRGAVSGFSPRVLRRLMLEREVQPDELASTISVSRQAVSAWLTGATAPSPASLLRVAEALDVQVETLTPASATKPRLADLRTRRGLTQAAAARELALAASTLSGIERGRRPLDRELAARLADLYGFGQVEVEQAWTQTVADHRRWLEARKETRRQRN